MECYVSMKREDKKEQELTKGCEPLEVWFVEFWVGRVERYSLIRNVSQGPIFRVFIPTLWCDLGNI